MANPYDPTDPPLGTEAMDDMIQFVFTYPPKISSNSGIWGTHLLHRFMLPMVQLRLIVIFFSTQILHFFLRPFGLSKITSEILAGFMLNIRVMNGNYATSHFVEEVLSVIAKFNYMLFLFIMGVKMDISTVKHIERKLWAFGSLIVLVPLALGVATTMYLSSLYQLNHDEQKALLHVSTIHSMTVFSVIACLVSELGILNSELGKLALTIATVSDLMSVFLYIVDISSSKLTVALDLLMIIRNIGYVTFYLGILVFVFRPYVLPMTRRTSDGNTFKGTYLFGLLATAFGSAGLSFMINLNMFLAPYLLGLAVPSGPPIASTVEAKYSCLINHIFLPFFVSFCSANANVLSIELDKDIWKSVVIILFVIVSAKLLVGLVLAMFCGLPRDNALVLALILSFKGVVEIANYTFAWELHIIPNRFYAIAHVVIFVTSAIIPILVRNLYNPSRKYVGYNRTLTDSKPESELPILACVYKTEHISPLVKLVDACIVNKGMPTAVHVLHLLTLTGQSTSVFIAHGLDRKSISNYSSSKDVIMAFRQLMRRYSGCMSLQAFTAVSPPHLMSEDVFTLALAKHTSLIILPFHRTWTVEGNHIDDNSTRTLNCNILDGAPCSVGILVNRGNIGSRHACGRSAAKSPVFNAAVIFFGGKDDREVLTLARRMAEKQNTVVTVIHVRCNVDEGYKNWDTILDSEALKDIKSGNCISSIMYKDVPVEDGNHMIEALRSLIGVYHLVIVGRRCDETSPHTKGLEIWSEFPELGVTGDLLTTTDFEGGYSILVVKQQNQVN